MSAVYVPGQLSDFRALFAFSPECQTAMVSSRELTWNQDTYFDCYSSLTVTLHADLLYTFTAELSVCSTRLGFSSIYNVLMYYSCHAFKITRVA
jgi:hypothetical protein